MLQLLQGGDRTSHVHKLYHLRHLTLFSVPRLLALAGR